MKRDAFIGSVFAGALSSVISALAQVIFIRMGLQAILMWNVAAGIFLPSNMVLTPVGSMMGFVGHLIIGAIWGVVFYILLLLYGRNGSLLKGALLGCFIWLFVTMMMRWEATNYPIYGTNEQWGSLFHHLIYGVSLGYLVPALAINGVSEKESLQEGLLANFIAQPAFKPDLRDEEPDPFSREAKK